MLDRDSFLDDAGAAHRLGISVRSLQKLRSDGGGPAYTRIGMKRIAYSITELDRWQSARVFTSRAHEISHAVPRSRSAKRVAA